MDNSRCAFSRVGLLGDCFLLISRDWLALNARPSNQHHSEQGEHGPWSHRVCFNPSFSAAGVPGMWGQLNFDSLEQGGKGRPRAAAFCLFHPFSACSGRESRHGQLSRHGNPTLYTMKSSDSLSLWARAEQRSPRGRQSGECAARWVARNFSRMRFPRPLGLIGDSDLWV